jgi:CheY-like chemotaxis protein
MTLRSAHTSHGQRPTTEGWRIGARDGRADDADFLELIREILEDGRYEATTIDGDRPDAIDRIRASRADVLMIDLRIGTDGPHGWAVARKVRSDPAFDGLPVLVCGADVQAMRGIADELAETQHIATLAKPFGISELGDAIDALLADRVSR